MFCEYLEELLGYQEHRWGEAVSGRWLSLCDGLREYGAPPRGLVIAKNASGSWYRPFRSQFGEAISRSHSVWFRQWTGCQRSTPTFGGVSASLPVQTLDPRTRRLLSLLVACSTIFLPRKAGTQNYDLLCYLPEQMCDLLARSRIYCSFGVIEPVASKHELPDLEFEDESIVAAILERKASVQMPRSLWQQWQKRNDWRAGAMLKYVGMTLPFEMTTVKMPVPPLQAAFRLAELLLRHAHPHQTLQVQPCIE
jgi:hypothetical protein